MSEYLTEDLNKLTENDWVNFKDQINGITLVKKELNNDEDLFNLGWSCMTPNIEGVEEKIWIEPENWTKVLQSLKSITTKINKEMDKQNWLNDVKKTLKVDNINEVNKGVQFNFVKNWKLALNNFSIILKSHFTIYLDNKEINNWIKNYSPNNKSINIQEFAKFIDPDGKWEELKNEWDERVYPFWEKIVNNISESDRDIWYGWIRKVWSNIFWNNDITVNINKMLESLTKMQADYELGREKQKRKLHLLNTENLINFDRFEEHFFSARNRERKITFFQGPPNTGKTYNSFNMLAAAKSGAYWSPLRLLALEGHETLLDRGIINNLITGEERKLSKGSHHVASTIEMANLRNPVDVAIIDEIQLLTDPERGWAWTQAYLGAPTESLVLTGSDAALPYLNNMNIYLGEEMDVTELFSEKKLIIEHNLNQNFAKLKEGDALIAFSRKEVLSWKEALVRKGYTVSTVYGHLSHDVRREEARKFREGETQILVSTDAIGLGLNLPIKRIIFTSVSKFDGNIVRILKPSEAWQIANRAGRKGWVENGSVTTWLEEDEETLRLLLESKDEKPKDYKWWVQPLPEQVELWNKKLGGTLSQILAVFADKMLQGHKVFKACPMTAAISRAEKLKHYKLNIVDMYAYATAPVDKEDLESEIALLEWAYLHSQGKKIKWSDVKHLWREKENYHSKGEALLDIEKKARLLTVYRWLTLRFPDIYYGNKEATIEHEVLNRLIEKYLVEIVRNKESKGKGVSAYKNIKTSFIN